MPVVYFLIIWVKVSKKSIMTSFKQKTFDNDSYQVEEEKDLPLSSVPLEVWNDKKGNVIIQILLSKVSSFQIFFVIQ